MDDFTNYLFPVQQDDPLLFQYSPIPSISFYHKDPTIHRQDLVNQGASSLVSPQLNTGENRNSTARKRQQKPSPAVQADNHDCGKNPDDRKQKRTFHRDMERQRRQEMANLYASLRNLLPLEYTKGKRSITDHVHVAENYIKQVEKNIRKLEVKRDKLRNLTGGSSHVHVKNVEGKNSFSINFTVRPCSAGGIEILMKKYVADTNLFPLSRILDVLLDEGLTVVSCVCTRVNEEFIYTIQTEASHMRDVDPLSLQEKLTEKVMTWKKFEP
ncbi:transcription factor bHLH118-like [Coffea eugenioides]|uniref:transcription factor bHLH118-like n=1 Tax=Coffea eugenioides TaxID=49369 RepID=UPI000F60ACEB|nr:transcription factor bHLH118-like [Coffea eugenioides]